MQVNQRERNFTKLAFVASVLAASCVVSAGGLVARERTLSHYALDTVILALIAIIADEMAVEVRDRVTVTAGTLPILLAVMFLGPIPPWPSRPSSGFGGLAGVLASSRHRSTAPIWSFPLSLPRAPSPPAASLVDSSGQLSRSGLLMAGAVAAILYEARQQSPDESGALRQVRHRHWRPTGGTTCLRSFQSLGVLSSDWASLSLPSTRQPGSRRSSSSSSPCSPASTCSSSWCASALTSTSRRSSPTSTSR